MNKVSNAMRRYLVGAVFTSLLLICGKGYSQPQSVLTFQAVEDPYLFNKIIIIAEESLADDSETGPKIERYAGDIWQGYGARVELYKSDTSTPEDIKDFIIQNSTDLDGVVFVGNIAKATMESFIEGHTSVDYYFSDFFYMDHDSQWLDIGRYIYSEAADRIEEDWGTGSPDAAVPVNYFSALWTGQIEVPDTGAYTFTITSDNGRRMYLDDNVIIDEWTGDWDTPYSSDSISLTAGTLYDVEVQYFESTGGANIVLEWTTPDGTTSVVPASAFSNLTVDYFYGTGDMDGITGDHGGNGIYDRVTDADGEITAESLRPEIFVARIETHTNTYFGTEKELMNQYLDKDHRYWSGQSLVSQRAIGHLGSGTEDDGTLGDRLGELFPEDDYLIKTDETGADDVNWLADLATDDYGVGVYLGHGSPSGLGLEGDLNYLEVDDALINTLYLQFASCSPLRSWEGPDDGDLNYTIGGAHLYGDNGEGKSLVATGATKTSGGDQREEFLYEALGDGAPLGAAFLSWATRRLDDDSSVNESDISWFYPQTIQGDPFVAIQSVPARIGPASVPETLRDYMIYGFKSVKLNDYVSLESTDRMTNVLVGSGAVGNDDYSVTLGRLASIDASIVSEGDVWLRDYAEVNGDITTGEGITKQNHTVVNGSEETDAELTVDDVPQKIVLPDFFNTDFDDKATVEVVCGEELTLNPGVYNEIKINNHGAVTFTGGIYFMNSLSLASTAEISFDFTNGPVRLYVKEDLLVHAALDAADDDRAIEIAENLLLVYTGTEDIFLSYNFFGSVIAPYVKVTAAQSNHKFFGTLLADEVEVHQQAILKAVPFIADRLGAAYPDVTENPTVELSSYEETVVSVFSGETVSLSASSWPGMDNDSWNADVALNLRAVSGTLPEGTVVVNETAYALDAGQYSQTIDIVDVGPYYIDIALEENANLAVTLTNI